MLWKTSLNITWYPSWTGYELSCDWGWSGMLLLGPRRRMEWFCNSCGAPGMCRIAENTRKDQKCENEGIMRRGCCNCSRGWFLGLDIVCTHHWPPVATGLPGSQCLLVQHLCTDSSLSFASKIMFSEWFKSVLVVLSYSSANVLMPALHSYWSASLTMLASATSMHW